MHWVSTDVRHFVQTLTPHKEDSNGVSGGMVVSDESGAVTELYESSIENPPLEYHIETDGELVSDWLVHEDGSISDFRDEMTLIEDHKVHIFDAIVFGMLVPAKISSSSPPSKAQKDISDE